MTSTSCHLNVPGILSFGTSSARLGSTQLRMPRRFRLTCVLLEEKVIRVVGMHVAGPSFAVS